MQIRNLGIIDYQVAYTRMQAFATARSAGTPDELWLLQHPPVYTLGLAARTEHLHQAGGIPVVKTDRGGQVTYHAPGQLIVYVMLDLKRSGYGVRSLVRRIEQALIDYLAAKTLTAARRQGAPGVYIGNAKIAALGLRVRNGCSYHGLALNIDMDLAPYAQIDPCGYPGLAVTRLKDCGIDDDIDTVAGQLLPYLTEQLCEPIQSTQPGDNIMSVAHG